MYVLKIFSESPFFPIKSVGNFFKPLVTLSRREIIIMTMASKKKNQRKGQRKIGADGLIGPYSVDHGRKINRLFIYITEKFQNIKTEEETKKSFRKTLLF